MAGGKKKSKQGKKKVRAEPDAAAPRETAEAAPAPPDAAPPRSSRSAGDTTGRGPLTEMVPVRFDAPTLSAVRQCAVDDHRSVSSWIRRAVDLELERGRATPR
jgi:hypothetical protein